MLNIPLTALPQVQESLASNFIRSFVAFEQPSALEFFLLMPRRFFAQAIFLKRILIKSQRAIL